MMSVISGKQSRLTKSGSLETPDDDSFASSSSPEVSPVRECVDLRETGRSHLLPKQNGFGFEEDNAEENEPISQSAGSPSWTLISFQRQQSFRRSQKNMQEFIQEKANEREDMQEKTFRKWVNVHLEKSNNAPIADLFKDFRDGVKLLVLLEVLTGQKLPREKGRMRVHGINNLNRALQFLQDQQVKLVNINSNDLADGNPKITLGLIWHIIQHAWQIFAADQELTYKEMTLQDVLKRWCHYSVQSYPGVSVKNFTSSWQDGLAFNAVLHNYLPDLFDFEKVVKMDAESRLAHAFEVAEKHLHVKKLLDLEDVLGERIDKKSIMTYLLLLFQALPHDTLATEEAVATPVSTPVTKDAPEIPQLTQRALDQQILPETSAASVAQLKEYQGCLEEVLTWLLEAEDRLAQFEPICEEDVEIVKNQFKTHEEFMLSLTQSQGGVGDALHSGQILIQSGQLGPEHVDAVQKQMGLVNEKWETLRQGAMERQSILQERLMALQHSQLVNMRSWLDEMESQINASSSVATDPDTVKKQNDTHRDFQEKIERQQPVVNSLTSFVAVVDESQQAEQRYLQLETTLQEIGKRWMAVCQWAEKRAVRLEGLEHALRALSVEQNHFADWLDIREAALGSLRSAHHLTNSKEVLEQVQNLQAMEQDLESEHPRFVRLSQLSSEVAAKLEYDNPIGGSEVRRKLEETTQRWDNLVVRMEEHSQMLIRSGKASPSQARMLPATVNSRTVIKEQTDGNSTVITKRTVTTVTRKHVVDETKTAVQYDENKDAAKKLKMETGAEDFRELLSRFCQWLENTEATLTLTSENLTPAEKVGTLQEVENDIDRRSAELERLHSVGHQLMEKISDDDGDSEEIQAQLHDASSRWRDIQLTLADRHRASLAAKEADKFQQDLIHIDRAVSELSDWADGFDAESLTEVVDIRVALRQCQTNIDVVSLLLDRLQVQYKRLSSENEKLELVKQKEPQVELMQKQLEELTEVGGPEVGAAQRDFERFTSAWARVVDRISGALEVLSSALERAPEPTLSEAIDALKEWLKGAEDVLQTEELDRIDHLDITEGKIDKLKELEAQRIVHADSMQFLNTAAQDANAESSGLSSEIMDSLNKRWLDIEQKTKDLLSKLENGLSRLREWDKCATELDSWLDQVTEFLHAEQPAHGDMAALKEQLEQSQGLISDMADLKPKLKQMEACVKDLAEQAAPALADYLTHRMDEVDLRWNDVERLSKAKNDSLQDAFARSHKVFDDILELSKFLAKVDEELSATGPPTTGKELQSLIKRHKHIREQLNERSQTVESAVNLAEELAACLEGSPEAVTAFRKQLKATRQQWTAICRHVKDRLAALTEAFEVWKEFQGLLAGERVCLDELQRKLNEPMSPAADAEEFSEQLDLLERLMEGGGSLGRIDTLGQQLISRGILVPAVQSELSKYKTRRDELMEPAKDRQRQLERGVTESQEFEEQLLNCQSWISHVDFILSCRLDSDILASDVPEEYKQLQSEFEEHDNCLHRLTEQVEMYERQDRPQAAERLREQLDHVKKMMSDLGLKFSDFKRPRDFEQRLDRASRILGDVEQGVGLLQPSGVCVADTESQLERCQEIQTALHELCSEIEYVVGVGNKLLEERILEHGSSLVIRFKALKGDHSQLTNQVSECEGSLERAKDVMRKYEAEQQEIVSFLSDLELRLAKWEAAEPSGKINEDLLFVQQIQQELPRRESSWAVMEDCLNSWQSLATNQSSEAMAHRFQSLRFRWKDFCQKLDKWHESLKNMRKDNEALLLEFEVLHGQVKTWLDSTESRLRDVNSEVQKNLAEPSASGIVTDPAITEQIKGLMMETSDLRPKVDQLRDKAVELMGRNEECLQKVEPDLTGINTRWESTVEALRDLQRQTHMPSMSPTTIAAPLQLEMADQEMEEITPTIIITSPTTVSLSSSRSTESRASSRLQRTDALREHSPNTPPTTPDESTEFANELERKIDVATVGICRVEEMMNFERPQPLSVPEWNSRTNEAKVAMEEARPLLEEIFAQGQSLADSGPMELHTQQTLERIDQLHSAARNVDGELEEQSENVVAMMAQYEAYRREVAALISWLDECEGRNLADPDIMKATQDELLEREATYSTLRVRGRNLQTQLPSVSPESEEDTLGQSAVSVKVTQIPPEPESTKLEDKWTRLERKLKAVGLKVVVKITDPVSVKSTPVSEQPVSVEETAVVKTAEETTPTAEDAAVAAETSASAKLIIEGVGQLDQSLANIESRLTTQPEQADREEASLVTSLGKYGNFSEQEDTLKAMKENLEAVGGMLEQLKASEKNLADAGAVQSEQDRLRVLLTSLQTRLARMKEVYAEKHKAYEHRLGVWQQFQRRIRDVTGFIDNAETTLKEWRLRNGSIDLVTMESLQSNLEKQTKDNAEVIEKIWKEANDIVPYVSGPDAAVLQDKLESLSKRWHRLTTETEERRQKLEERQADDTELREELDELLFWCDETEALLQCQVDPSNKVALLDLLQKYRDHSQDYTDKLQRLKFAEKAKDKYIELRLVPNETKQQVRRDVAELTTKMIKMKPRLEKRLGTLEERAGQSLRFWSELDSLTSWTSQTKALLDEYHAAIIYTPTRLDPSVLEAQLKQRQVQVENLTKTYDVLRDEAKLESESGEMEPETRFAMEQFMMEWSAVLELAAAVRTSSSSSVSEERDSVFTAPEEEVGKKEATQVAPEPLYSPIVKKSRTRMERSEERLPRASEPAMEGRTWKEEEAERASTYPRIDSGSIMMVSAATQKAPSDPKGAQQFKELVQLRHWLGDAANEAGGQVDLVNIQAVREAMKAQQNLLDQYHAKRLHLIRILEDSSQNHEVQHKAEVLSHEWERAVGVATRRKRELGGLLEDARKWDTLKSELELWLAEGNKRTTSGPKVTESSLEQLQQELSAVEGLFASLDEYKGKMTELNKMGNQLLDQYPSDDATALSQNMSDLNTQWSKFNDNVRIRRAVLEASLRSRKDFQTALREFEEWIGRLEVGFSRLELETDNSQEVKDAQKRKSWMDREKELRLEMEAHEDVLTSLQDMGSKLADSLEASAADKAELLERLGKLNGRWTDMVTSANHLRKRLESAQEQWEKLTSNLKELIYWIDSSEKELVKQQPIAGDMAGVTEQCNYAKNLKNDIETKTPQVKETVHLAHSFLIQQDMRPRLSSPTESDEENENTVASELSARRIARQIKTECDTLEEKWKEFQDRADRWKKVIEDALNKMIGFDKAVGSCEESLKLAEATRRSWTMVKDIQLDELPNEMAKSKNFRHQLQGVRRFVDDVNDHSSRLLADNIQLSSENVQILESINSRYKQLDSGIGHRLSALNNAMKDFGPSSQHFLAGSVAAPWERRISASRVPYFVNHEIEKTQWDHPKMVNIANQLCEFNEIKFSAYRTSIKLRALQKRLCLDLVTLEDADIVFTRQNLQNVNDKLIDTSEMIMTLLPIYEKVQTQWPDLLKSLPLAIDLCLNWLLNVYDPVRTGSMRVLSFKVALVLLCSAHLDEKYKYLFEQVSTSGIGVDQKKLALLLYDCIQIPKFLGEVAAFGGSNIEPSVRSCFEKVKFPQEVKQADYLEWLKEEPQSLVWLPVLHRIAAAENAKHQAKCNICKMFPIVGLRYRCLKCFNFDICQSCFFSQRVAKGHRLAHPMQEYCVASTSGEDVRDFGKVVRNKFKSKRYFRKHPRLGYLPVQSVTEGSPIESRSTTPTNPYTQHLHGRLELFSSRLAMMDKSQTISAGDRSIDSTDFVKTDDEHTVIANLTNSLAVPDGAHSYGPESSVLGAGTGAALAAPRTPKSPAQIVSQIDHMQKEELDQILKQLEEENLKLQQEYDRLRTSGGGIQGAVSTPQLPMTNGSLGRRSGPVSSMSNGAGRSMGSLPRRQPATIGEESRGDEPSEEDLLVEAKALRQHKQRLEERSRVLEDHNAQLEVQLMRLKQLIDEHQMHSTGDLNEDIQSPMVGVNGMVTSQQSTHSTPYATPVQSAHSSLQRGFQLHSALPEDTDSSAHDQTGSRIGSLMTTAQDLGRAMETLVTAVTSDDELSDEET